MRTLRYLVFSVWAACGLSSCASSPALGSGRPDYAGAWAVELCEGRQAGQPCGTFDLYLTQDEQGRICGEHFVATPGLGRLDESDPSTVLGVVGSDAAVVVIRSTRNDARYMARIFISDGQMQWRRIGMLASGSDDETSIIPERASLERSAQVEKQRYQAKVAESGCRWPDWTK